MDNVKLHKYEGILEFYFETGFEHMAVIFHDNRGNHEAPHWDTKNHPNEMKTYRSLEWAIFFGDKAGYHNIRIFDKENNVVYEGPITKDKKKMKEDRYRVSFIPKEIDKRSWFRYCREEYRAELFTNLLTIGLEKEFGNEFKVGEIAHDDLTNKDVFILHITQDSNKNLGYWIKEDGKMVGRLPHELSKIDWSERFKKEFNK